jgi:hypothetical protein
VWRAARGQGPRSALSVLGPCAPRARDVPPLAAGARKGLRIRGDRGPHAPAPTSQTHATATTAPIAVTSFALGWAPTSCSFT